MVLLTDDPFMTGYYEPVDHELTVDDLAVTGTIPDGLSGSFYRNGPNPVYAPHPQDRYHVFDGDGMIYAVHLGGGRAAMRNRWVRTPKFTAEQAAGKRLFGVFGNPRFNDPAANYADYNTANTHIWPHGGKLYALMEGCPPVELDPDSLATLGSETFGGAAAGPFTAHPKTDPDSGELHAFGYSAKGPGSTAIRYNVIGRDGSALHTSFVEQPYSSMMHDFLLTEHAVVFPCLPVTLDLQRAMAGKPMAAWDSSRGAAFGVMPRGGGAVRWVDSDPRFMFHSANSYEAGGDIVIDVAGSLRAPLMPDADGTLPHHSETRFTLKRWIVGASGSVSEAAIDDLDIQFPRIDDRVQGRRYRYAFVNGTARPSAGRIDGFDRLARIDVQAGTRVDWHGGDGAYIGEPVFVPRPGGSAEGDGWLLALRWDSLANVSDLLILDAAQLADGPVATVRMPERVPGGFHCHWRGD